MGKIILGLMVAFFTGLPAAHSCDVCGSVGSSSNGINILPQFRSNWAGVLFGSQCFRTRHPASILNPEKPLFSEETFLEVNLSGRLFLSDRWQVLFSLPYRYNSQSGLGEDLHLDGIGDAQVTSFYSVLDKRGSPAGLQFNWMIGGGLLIPTGSYRQLTGTERRHIYLETGTGSWGGSFSSIFTLRRKAWGMQASTSVQFFQLNPENFQPGTQGAWQVSFLRVIQGKGFSVIPRVAMRIEKTGQDKQEKEKIDLSGGTRWGIRSGLDLFLGRIIFSVDYSKPFDQHVASGRVEQLASTSARILYTF